MGRLGRPWFLYGWTRFSFLEHPHIAKHRLRPALRIAAHQKTDHPGGICGVAVGGDDELPVDVEAELGATGYDEEGVGGGVAAGGWCWRESSR